jgi:hypothetical protein
MYLADEAEMWLILPILHSFIKQAGNQSDSLLRLSIEKPCYNSYPPAIGYLLFVCGWGFIRPIESVIIPVAKHAISH